LLPLGAQGIRETLRFTRVSWSKTVARTPRMEISLSQGRYLTQTQNKHKQPSTPWVGFEPTIPVFEQAKIFHALDREATVIGTFFIIG
jgi:hypothetical protein